MSKRYVLEDAQLHCTNGSEDCPLISWTSRHIYAENKAMANMTDFDRLNVRGAVKFNTCISAALSGAEWKGKSQIAHHHHLVATNPGVACKGIIQLLQWQNVKDDVYIGKYPALMHDSWTVCLGGLGIVTLNNSGQSGENFLETLQENLEELEKIVDAYMAANGIDPSHKDELMDSILLWHGYESWDMPWNIRSNEMIREFCDYMQLNHKYLYGFFEKGLYLEDGDYGKIDLTYMMGIARANEGLSDACSLVTSGMATDKGMLNGYLAAIEQGEGKSGYQALVDYLKDYTSPEYDGSRKYITYVPEDSSYYEEHHGAIKYEQVDIILTENGDISVKEKNAMVMQNQMELAIEFRNRHEYDPEVDGEDLELDFMEYWRNDNVIAAESIMQQIMDGSKYK